MTDYRLQKGWNDGYRQVVAVLYEGAFGPKFQTAIPDKQQRLAILSEGFLPEYSFVILDGQKVIGLAGIQTREGALTGGISVRQLIKRLGFWRGCWACFVFALFEREPTAKEMVLDGLVIDSAYRGEGLGTRLLDACKALAIEQNYQSLRLDVIDSNSRARALYEREGFVETARDYHPWLKRLVGFSYSTTMVCKLDALSRSRTEA
ncbi:GNAT family N-acetyltransferase [Thaumasiovibrio subtropicus]|nr:GNAT family N-acetyltransferase [Thaumasiovibrio subtropicus]